MFHIESTTIRDEFNRQRIFKGINYCLKYETLRNKDIRIIKRFFKKDIQAYVENGFNILRLGFNWASVEPVENNFDDRAFDLLKEIVEECQKNNIYVILDAHQDLFYSNKGIGDGAPEWITKDYKKSHPLVIWAEGYFYMKDVQRAFNDFWQNKNQMQDKFVKMWHRVIDEFKGYDNIIAYDYFNEPMINDNASKAFCTLVDNALKYGLGIDFDAYSFFENGDEKRGFVKMGWAIFKKVKTLKNLKIMLNTMDSYELFKKSVDDLDKYVVPFNNQYFEPFYNKMVNECSDEKHFNLFEHSYYSNLGVPFVINAKGQSVYSPHAYDIFIDSPLYNRYSSNERMKVIIDGIKKNQDEMQVPVIMGEWGGNSPTGKEWLKHIDYVYNLLEQNQWSHLYWSFNYKNKNVVNTLSRPYPIAVCGDIIEYHSDSKTRTFTLKYNQPAEFEGKDIQTEIYTPQGIKTYKGETGLNEITINY